MASNKEAKEHFESLIELRGDISSVLDTLRAKHDVLVGIYQDLTTTHRSKDFVFGLDSFFFQNELIQGECKHLSSVFGSIDNRVYCEYLTGEMMSRIRESLVMRHSTKRLLHTSTSRTVKYMTCAR